jgi:hypothetical protein
MPEITIKQQAQMAVEDKLGLRPVIDTYEKDFLDTLVDAHKHARGVLGDSNVAFFADVIPWVASLIQVYVTQPNFLDAIEWVRAEFRGTTKPISILTVLTTIYLIQRGCERHNPAQDAVWREISERQGALLDDETRQQSGNLTEA